MAKVALVNVDNIKSTYTSAPVEMHKLNCRHLMRYAFHPFFEPAWVLDVDTPQDAAYAYNSDFIAEAEELGEDPNDAVWDIAVFPCTGMVSEKKVLCGTGDA